MTLEVRGLTKHYPTGVAAVDGVDVAVGSGELVALLGPNGSGKSTLLRCVARLLDADAGSVVLDGTELTGLSGAALRRVRPALGMIFQRSCLVRRRSAADNVAAGSLGRRPGWRTALGMLPADERTRAVGLLRRVGLDELAAQRADTLSGGQAQRVAVARALAQEPSTLLADEPVASLDPDAATDVMELLRDLAHTDGLAVLCVLHQPELAVAYADRIVGLDRGRVVLDAPASGAHAALAGLYRDRPGCG